MNRDSIQSYVDQSEFVLESSPQMDEANTKAAILRDFLDFLEWDIPENTRLEYSVEAFGQTYKVDYALILDGAPVAFLEAKGADTALTVDHDEQLASYMMNKNVNYGILTNGKQYRFFQRRVDASNVNVQKVGDVSLAQLPDRLAVLEAYTKEAIESGESEKILGRINALREARDELESGKDELAKEVSGMLSESVSDTLSPLAEPQAKEMVDRLIDDIEAEIDSDEGETTRSTKTRGSTEARPNLNHLAGSIKRSEIRGDGDGKVAVFPTKESGLPFLMENNAWGFVRVGSEFDYVAMYVTGDAREVRYMAKVRDVITPEEAELARPPEEYADGAKIADDKFVIRFEEDSLYELEDPVPFEDKYPQSLQYTTLEALRTAQTTNDML